jgi:hypothetical protein
MPIDEGEWTSIEALVEDAFRKRGIPVTQGIVLRSDPENRHVYVKEFGDQPIPVVNMNSQMYVVENGLRRTLEIPVAIPKVGDTVILVVTSGLIRCLGKIDIERQITTPPHVTTPEPSGDFIGKNVYLDDPVNGGAVNLTTGGSWPYLALDAPDSGGGAGVNLRAKAVGDAYDWDVYTDASDPGLHFYRNEPPASTPMTLLKDALTLLAAVKLVFGGDTNLYRSAANELKTDDSLVIAGARADAPTPPVAADDTRIATTAWTKAAVGAEIAKARYDGNNIAVTATTHATSQAICTLPAITFDGTTRYRFISSIASIAAPLIQGAIISVALYEMVGGTPNFSVVMMMVVNPAAAEMRVPGYNIAEFIPAAGSRIYALRAYVTGGQGAIIGAQSGLSSPFLICEKAV